MAQRRIIIPDIGEVILAKRRGSTNMRLSINAKGQVRVGMPYWAPYEAGLLFIKSKKKWVQQHLAAHAPTELKNGDRIGKAHRLIVYRQNPIKNNIAETRLTATTVEVNTMLAPTDLNLQRQIAMVCEKALKMEALQLLPARVNSISQSYQLEYSSLKIRKLTSRWGSCSAKKSISLSYFLVQLPWELIDYVILHELAHTKILHHGQDFWAFMEGHLPNARQLKKQLKKHKPRIEPI